MEARRTVSPVQFRHDDQEQFVRFGGVTTLQIKFEEGNTEGPQ